MKHPGEAQEEGIEGHQEPTQQGYSRAHQLSDQRPTANHRQGGDQREGDFGRYQQGGEPLKGYRITGVEGRELKEPGPPCG